MSRETANIFFKDGLAHAISTKIFQENYQSVILSVLIWVQTVCKGNQQTKKVAASKERVNIVKAINERESIPQ